jgi:hypothetical protein
LPIRRYFPIFDGSYGSSFLIRLARVLGDRGRSLVTSDRHDFPVGASGFRERVGRVFAQP